MDGPTNGFDFFEQIWKSGNNIMSYHPKVGYQVQMYALNELNKIISTLPENVRPKLIDMINRSKSLKSQYPQAANCSKDEFVLFIKKFYTKLREEDSKGRITKDLGYNYKLLYNLIFAFKSFEPQIPKDFIEVSQICKKKYIDIINSFQINVPNSNFGGVSQNEYQRRNTPIYNNNNQNPYCQTAPNSSRPFIPQNNALNSGSGPINYNYPEGHNQGHIGRTLSNNLNPYYPNQNMQGENSIRPMNIQPMISKPSFNESSNTNGKTYVNSQNGNQNGINENNLLEVNMRKYGELIKSNNMKAIIEIQNGRIETGIQLLKNSLNFTMN